MHTTMQKTRSKNNSDFPSRSFLASCIFLGTFFDFLFFSMLHFQKWSENAKNHAILYKFLGFFQFNVTLDKKSKPYLINKPIFINIFFQSSSFSLRYLSSNFSFRLIACKSFIARVDLSLLCTNLQS